MMRQSVLQNNVSYDKETAQYMSLSIGSINILTPRSNIIALESFLTIDNSNPAVNSIGNIQHKDKIAPVYCLSDLMEVHDISPKDNLLCAVLEHEGSYISLACLEANAFNKQMIKRQSLPECMRSTAGPIESLYIYDNNNTRDAAFIVTADSLVRFVAELKNFRE